MIVVRRFLCLFGILAAGFGSLAWASDRPLVFGYAAWWVPQSETLLSLPDVDRLKFMELRLSPQGRIANRHGWPEQWTALREGAANLGIPLDVAVTLFSPDDFNALFGSSERVQRLEKEMLSLVQDKFVAGIHLDVEIFAPVLAEAAQRYRAFVVSLSGQLKQQSPVKSLSVFLNHAADVYLYDAESLVGVDHVILQGYDAHWVDGDVAGPLGPLSGPDTITWQKMWATAQKLGLPPQRVLMGFPTYGYEWTVKPCSPRGKRIAPGETTVFGRVLLPQAPNLRSSVMGRVLAHGVQYDDISGSAYYTVGAANGSCVVGWFEDWWTLNRKIDWLISQQLAGIAFFPLGYDNGTLVNTASRRFRQLSPTMTK